MTSKKFLTFLIVIPLVLLAATATLATYLKANADPSETTVSESSTEAISTPAPTTTETPTETTVAEPEPVKLTIVATGDTFLARGVGNRLISQGRSAEYPFEPIKGILSLGDVVFTNLEVPITASEKGLIEFNNAGDRIKYVLRMKPELFGTFQHAGFNMVGIANNHIMDFYEKGLVDTLKILDDNNILHAGAGMNLEEARKPAVMEVDGIKIALLSYTDMAYIVYAGNPNLSFAAANEKSGVAPREKDYILSDISEIRDSVDIIMVSLHWGLEETFIVTDEMRQFAYDLIDNGADVILGHHPHQFQGIEIYDNKPIIYSMGNLIMDQNDPENQEGFIVVMEYENSDFMNMTCYPIRTIEKVQVVLLNEENGGALMNRQIGLSGELGTIFSKVGDTLVYTIPETE
ncbi:MAG: CapA family protein [Eubacteriales bacterium]|nr:CapA family protein [Eubacteriales bacterium]